MRRSIPALVLSSLACLACAPDTTMSDSGFADGRTLVQVFEPDHRAPRVDLILVVDDSASMGAFTPSWAENLAAFAAVIEAEDVHADVRIAITTTSVPGPTCAGPRAIGGEPSLSSCRSHLDDFVGADEHGELGGEVVDRRAVCEDACSLAEIPRTLSPGRDDLDLSSLALRPWIEPPHNPHGGNLDGVSLAEALTCVGLQGSAGCSFESPIEAAARMVEHLGDPTHPLAEFRRPDAALMILFVGDEDDCSHPDASASVFDPGGERLFWPDPAASEPTSGICIRAGARCDADGCALQDHALDGTPTADPGGAVLMPTDRLRAALVAAGEYDDPVWIPYVASIGGYTSQGDLYFAAAETEDAPEAQPWVEAFAIAPGCAAPQPFGAPTLRAGPGARLAAAASEGSLFSICEPDWSAAMAVFAERIKPGFSPWCIEFECVADLTPDDPTLEPDCVLEEIDYADERTPIPACERDADGWLSEDDGYSYVYPAGAEACWVWRTDADQSTASLLDDVDSVCADEGRLGNVAVTRKPGAPLPYASHYELRCRPCG